MSTIAPPVVNSTCNGDKKFNLATFAVPTFTLPIKVNVFDDNTCSADATEVSIVNFICIGQVRYQVDGGTPTIHAYTFADGIPCPTTLTTSVRAASVTTLAVTLGVTACQDLTTEGRTFEVASFPVVPAATAQMRIDTYTNNILCADSPNTTTYASFYCLNSVRYQADGVDPAIRCVLGSS